MRIAIASTVGTPIAIEGIGGKKNYDYRYAWIRDAGYVIKAFLRLGAHAEASAVLADDKSFVGAMSAIFTVGLMHVTVSWLKLRYVWFERICDGTPIVVYRDGDWDKIHMRRLRPALLKWIRKI